MRYRFLLQPDKVDKVEEIEKYPFWRGGVLENLSRGLFRGRHSEGELGKLTETELRFN